jgi:hypothetical protein
MNAGRGQAHTRSRNLDGNWDLSPHQVFRLAHMGIRLRVSAGISPAFPSEALATVEGSSDRRNLSQLRLQSDRAVGRGVGRRQQLRQHVVGGLDHPASSGRDD